MNIAVIQFPGSNCERETILALKRVGLTPQEFLWNESKQKLAAMQGYVIVGGFSYEDRSRAGIIAALDPIMQEIKNQTEQGKPVLGICNGAQILVEAGLVPGLENNKLAMVLTTNKRISSGKILGTGYYNAWIKMRLTEEYQRNAFTRHLTPKQILQIPIAHAEGRFVMSNALLSEIKAQGLNLFQYCDAEGTTLADFPVNPNGSIDNIAAISNKRGNVLAMMPHPERTTQGDVIFQSMRDYIAEQQHEQITPLYYYPRRFKMNAYQKPADSFSVLVRLLITDNEALTVQNTLVQMGFNVKVKRWTHWEIACDSKETLTLIRQTELLYNPRKEMVDTVEPATNLFLVKPQEDWEGQLKLQTLTDHFFVRGVGKIVRSVLWQFTTEDDKLPDQNTLESILQTNIIFNPFAHECYQYC